MVNTTTKILELVKTDRTINLIEISKKLKVSPGTVSYHMAKAIKVGYLYPGMPRLLTQKGCNYLAQLKPPLKIWIPLLPPGINQTYRIGNGHMYKSREANDWAADAAMVIGSAAVDWVDESEYYEICIELHNDRHDVDAPIKLVIDTVAAKLGFNDNRIMKQCSEKKMSNEKGIMIELRPYVL